MSNIETGDFVEMGNVKNAVAVDVSGGEVSAITIKNKKPHLVVASCRFVYAVDESFVEAGLRGKLRVEAIKYRSLQKLLSGV